MDIEKRISAMEWDISFLRAENTSRHEMILAAFEEINRLHERIDKLISDNNAGHKQMNDRHKVSEDIQDIIGEKLYPVFYKVFPEAIEADEAIERAMKAQKAGKGPTE